MRTAWQAFWQKPTTKIGIAAAIMFQLIFSIVWMTGYDGVTDRVSDLKIVVVNEDPGAGKQIVENVKANVPFRVSVGDNLDAAKRQLDDREVHMVLRVPADFSKQLQTPGQKGQLQFWINESNPVLIKNVMQGVAANVTAAVNKEAVAAGAQAVFAQMNVPSAQAQGIAQGLAEKVTADMQYTNRVSGMNNQMVPMMLVLASYVGSMILAMNLQQSSAMVGARVSKWNKFAVRSAINVFAAVLTSLVGTSFVLMLGGQSQHGFWAMWGFQALFLLAFMFFSQIFLLLLGNAGMLLNILALSAQLVSSGAMVPRELLSGFYQELGRYLPASYAVEGSMNLLFGGPGIADAAWALVAIAAVSLVIGLLVTAIRKEKFPVASSDGAPQLAH